MSTVLDLREVYARPWAGRASMRTTWWLRWLPFVHDSFSFRTEVVPDGDDVLVHDTQTFPNGRVWQRTMRGVQMDAGRWRLTANDMPGGAEITVDSSGYSFSYTIWAPVLGPIRLPLQCQDDVRFESEDRLVDIIKFRFLGLHVGTLTMRLQRT